MSISPTVYRGSTGGLQGVYRGSTGGLTWSELGDGVLECLVGVGQVFVDDVDLADGLGQLHLLHAALQQGLHPLLRLVEALQQHLREVLTRYTSVTLSGRLAVAVLRKCNIRHLLVEALQQQLLEHL
jgi:hypothetical protein